MQDDPLRKLGRIIFKSRMDQGLSQATVAIRSKLRSGNISYVETGENEGGFLKIARICRVLGLSLDKLMQEIDG